MGKNLSLGVIEVTGLVNATVCVDAMLKSTYVDIYNVEKVGSGLVAIMIQGDLASVQVALEIGADAASENGQVLAVKTLARPADGLEKITFPKEAGGNDNEET